MKYQISLLIFIIAIYQSCMSQDVDFKRLSENSVITNADTLKKINGDVYQHFFASGEVEYEGKLINDKKEGKWITYYKNGSLCKEIDYKKGQKNGKFIWYFQNGNKQQEVSLVNGIKQGEDKYWNEDGTLNSIITYKNGEEIEIRAFKPNYVNTTDSKTYNGEIVWKKE